MALKKIISGGQTGAERAALDIALKFGFPHGGWLPKERLAEDGPLSDKYNLQEIATDNYLDIYKKNILESNGTLLIFCERCIEKQYLTQKLAKSFDRPHIEINLKNISAFTGALKIASWINENNVEIMHVTGPPTSEDVLIYDKTKDIIEAVLQLDITDFSRTDIFDNLKNRNPAFKKAFPPKTVADAVERLMATMTFREKTRYANLAEDKLDRLYDAFFMQIRTEFRILGNDPLLASCKNISGEEKIYPDRASFIIIKELWRSLQNENILRVIKSENHV